MPGRQPKWFPLQELAVSPFAELGSSFAPNDGWAQSPSLAGVGVPQDYVCLDCWRGVHPGEFRTWYGDKAQAGDGSVWVEVWREFEDGCVHFQMQRSDGWWDMNPDGSPRVCWVFCVHGK